MHDQLDGIWDRRPSDAKTFYLPSADYIWPHVMNQKFREVVSAHGGSIVGEEYFPLDHTDYRSTVERIRTSGADVVFNTIVPPGVVPFFEQRFEVVARLGGDRPARAKGRRRP